MVKRKTLLEAQDQIFDGLSGLDENEVISILIAVLAFAYGTRNGTITDAMDEYRSHAPHFEATIRKTFGLAFEVKDDLLVGFDTLRRCRTVERKWERRAMTTKYHYPRCHCETCGWRGKRKLDGTKWCCPRCSSQTVVTGDTSQRMLSDAEVEPIRKFNKAASAVELAHIAMRIRKRMGHEPDETAGVLHTSIEQV